MARELPYIAAIGEAVHQEMERDDTVLYFGQNLGLTEDDPYAGDVCLLHLSVLIRHYGIPFDLYGI